MLVQRDTEPNLMDLVLILMNVTKDVKFVDMERIVTILQVAMNVFVPKDIVETRTMDYVLLHKEDALQTRNVDRMRNVFNQANVFVHHRSS